MAFDAHSEVAPTPAAPDNSTPPALAPETDAGSQSSTGNIADNSTTVVEKPIESKDAALPAGDAQTPAFTPNYKLKVVDKEFEIPESFRAIMKDAESEKQVREMFEKAHGLDFVKPRFNELREKHTTLEKTHQGVMASVQDLRETYKRGDFDEFFTKLGIPEQKVLQWVLDKAQYQELPPEQRAALDARKAAEKRAVELEKQLNGAQSQQYEQAVQVKQQLLTYELAKSDVKAFADAFDAQVGKPGSFLQEVANRGELAWSRSNGTVDLTPAAAIAEVMSLFKGSMARPEPGVIPAAQPAPVAHVPQPTAPEQRKPTLPNIAGRTTSPPAKPQPQSIDELKQLYKKMSGQG